MSRSTRDVLILTGIGLLLRLNSVRLGPVTTGDAPEYLTLAKNIAINHVFSLEAGGGSLLPTARRPPLYPALIAVFWWGQSPPFTIVLVLQALLGAATVGLVYLMARDKFNRTSALIAGAGMALAPMSGYYTASILTETLFTFLITCGFFFWGREQAIAAGVFLGLGALTRPTMVPFLALLPLLALLPAWRRYWRTYLLILGTAAAVSSVWIVRNAVVFGRFIPIAASGWGTNLLVGTIKTNFSGDDVWTAVLNDPNVTIDLSGLSETEKDRVQLKMALRRIRENPVGWLVLRAKQYPRLFLDTGDYWSGSGNITFAMALRERRPLIILRKVAFALGNLLLVGLTVFGVYAERARFIELSHLTLFPIFFLIVQFPMWGESRYTLPIMPVMATLAAVGVTRVATNWCGYRLRKVTAAS